MLLMPMVIISTQMKNSKRKISKQYKCKGPKDTSLTKTTAHDARNEHNHFTIPRGIYVLSSASAFRFFFLSPRTEFINWCVWWKCSSGQGDERFQLLNGKKNSANSLVLLLVLVEWNFLQNNLLINMRWTISQ